MAADVLLIVPPVGAVGVPSLPVHLLQAGCKGLGISADVLYCNLDYARLVGFDFYDRLAKLNGVVFVGERLFCRGAFGGPVMGKDFDRSLDDPLWMPDHLWQNRNAAAARKMSVQFSSIRRWMASVDWEGVEARTMEWLERQAREIAGRGYGVVGCSNTLGGLTPGLALLRSVKTIAPETVTVLGGAQCEGEMGEGILSLDAGVDYVFSGESDETFPGFVKDILDGVKPGARVIDSPQVMDLDTLPLPDFREYFEQSGGVEAMGLAVSPGERVPVAYETSRGCRWGKCAFCGMNGKRHTYRARSADVVIRDLKRLTGLYPGHPVLMMDNIMPRAYLESLFPRIEKEVPGVRILFQVDAHLSLEQLIVLKRAGVYQVQPGIESFSASLLKRIRKNGTVEKNIRMLRHARSVGLDVSWYLLYGVPGDTVEEYRETLAILPLIRHLQPPVRLNAIEIPRFSMYQLEPGQFGITGLRPAGLYDGILPEGADAANIAFFFAGEFPSGSYEDPDILEALSREFRVWGGAWKHAGTGDRGGLPRLHLERAGNQPGDGYVLHDTRGLEGRPETVELDEETAGVIAVGAKWTGLKAQQWAVDEKLAIELDGRFIPLCTGNPGLILEFEEAKV